MKKARRCIRATSFSSRWSRSSKSSGRSVPVFNDKHLSTEWSAMRRDGRRLEAAAVSIPGRLVAAGHPANAGHRHAVRHAAVGKRLRRLRRMDSYDFHGLETAQCMSERRNGGEVGIRSVQALRGEKMWDYVAGRDTTKRLLVAALTRSHNLPSENGYPTDRRHVRMGAQSISRRLGLLHRTPRRPAHDAVHAPDSRFQLRRAQSPKPAKSFPARCIFRCPTTARRRRISSTRLIRSHRAHDR